MKWLDPYEIRARIAPAAIVALPLAIAVLCIVYNLSDSLLKLLGSGVILLVLIYAFDVSSKTGIKADEGFGVV